MESHYKSVTERLQENLQIFGNNNNKILLNNLWVKNVSKEIKNSLN